MRDNLRIVGEPALPFNDTKKYECVAYKIC